MNANELTMEMSEQFGRNFPQKLNEVFRIFARDAFCTIFDIILPSIRIFSYMDGCFRETHRHFHDNIVLLTSLIWHTFQENRCE